MSASPLPRGSRSSRPFSRARGASQPRGNRAAYTNNGTRKVDPQLGPSGATPTPTRASTRSGATRGPSRRAMTRGPSLYRARSRQIWNTPRPTTSNSNNDGPRDATSQEQTAYRKYMEKIFTTLGEQRTQERKDAIRDGLLADPDKPTTLANAITIIGTCNDMCAEFERAQRIVQFMVDDCEKVPHATKKDVKVPAEDRMVKRYRRPAAGYEEQLPSDIRPPAVLQKTLNYLMDELVGGPEPLANVHKFVWDRTRAIRNDFSIQQVTKVEELRIAISCFERIARFHILSLHQLAGASENSIDFDAYQEREQLNNTLLSLMYYYDDSRHKLVSPNEAEFRAYCIIFEIQDQRPDLEDRAQNWPASILKDRRVQTALKLYAAAANPSDVQGPLRPQAPNAVAQANVTRFFSLIQSPAVPYLMACVAEIYFNKVRRTALDTIWKAYRVKRGGSAKVEDWTLADVTDALGFDDEDQAQAFCEEHGFTVPERNDGGGYIDLGSVSGRYLSDTNPSRNQSFSICLVEQKRRGRTLPAITNGLTAAQAQAQGLVEDYSENEGSSRASSRRSSMSNEETLFLPNGSAITQPGDEPTVNGSILATATAQEKLNNNATKLTSFLNPSASPFQTPEAPKPVTPTTTSFFGKPSISSPAQPANQPFAPPSTFQFPATSSPFVTNDKQVPVPNPSNAETRPDSAPSPFTINNPTNPARNPFSSLNKPDGAPVKFDAATLGSGQVQPNYTPTTSSSRSLFDVKPSSASDLPKFSFGTSPLFNQNATTGPSQLGQDNNTSFPAGPRPQAEKPAENGRKPQESPFKFLNTPPSTPAAPSSTPLSQLVAPAASKETSQSSPNAPFSSFFLQTATPNAATPMDPLGRSDKPAINFGFASTESAEKPAVSFPSPQTSNIGKPSQQALFQQAPTTASLISKTTPLSSPKSTPSPSATRSSDTAAVALRPDPRPAVLDALAEGLMMDDQGLLQQFIEFTMGPIVHAAFRDVEEERSWKRARKAQTFILSRKYLRRWKDNAWKRKLLRKGKERRATFAKSMQEMARSSRQRQVHNEASLQSSLMGKYLDPGTASSRENTTAPASLPHSNLKRKSLPTDFGGDSLPNAESTKRRRQEPPERTKTSKHSLHQSTQPHHKRSRTMGESHSSQSAFTGLAEFRYLDENAHINDRVIQQARRLVGNAKLDTTRSDYFQLKSRGIDPDISLIPPSGTKRSKVDEQIERVRKLSKPSSSDPPKPTPRSSSAANPTNGTADQVIENTSITAVSSNRKIESSPGDLVAQIRQVRESLAESTAWFKEEREKSERLSSSRSSEAPQNVATRSLAQTQHQPEDYRPRQWDSAATRARLRLEKTKANGLLPPDWDWNKSVTEWKAKGGIGSLKSNSASRDQSGLSTPAAAQQQKKPLGLAGMTNGFGRRTAKVSNERDVLYDDEEDSNDEGVVEDFEDGDEEGDEDDEDDHVNGYEEEYEEDYEEEKEDEDDVPPPRAVLKTQGHTAENAIDLSD
ncbi:MAG: hypothetical protein Q9181_002295 [Wetmoreana brouardii]